MIEGLHVDVTSDELKKLLVGRLKYHEEKIALYTQQREKLVEAEKLLAEEAAQMSKFSGSRTPLDSVEESLKQHRRQVIYYKFMAEHVVLNETYRLHENDLSRLGISS